MDSSPPSEMDYAERMNTQNNMEVKEYYDTGTPWS